ncbi:hypothetical protein OPIT5_16725 [Opitutaceae bacterium TAV5]|nr:hypothetical protein OPIT5_16725 [Opitutaceae bacterium TAV5]
MDQWTDKQRTAYLDAVARFRKENPSLFTPDELKAADNYGSAAAAPAPEFDLWDATKEALAESTSKVFGGIGNGVSLAVPVWLRWLIGGAIVAFIINHVAPFLPRSRK